MVLRCCPIGGIWNGSKHSGEGGSWVGCGSVGRHATGCRQANPPYMGSWDQQLLVSTRSKVLCHRQYWVDTVLSKFYHISSHSTCSCDFSDSKNVKQHLNVKIFVIRFICCGCENQGKNSDLRAIWCHPTCYTSWSQQMRERYPYQYLEVLWCGESVSATSDRCPAKANLCPPDWPTLWSP